MCSNRSKCVASYFQPSEATCWVVEQLKSKGHTDLEIYDLLVATDHGKSQLIETKEIR